MEDSTYIKLFRKLIEWEWFMDSKMVHLFIYLLLKANYSDNLWRGFEVKRGQLITGRLRLSAETGMSEQSIRTCLKNLKSTNEITIQSTNEFSVITLCNYNNYQEYQPANQPANQPAINQQPTTIKERKEKEESINVQFEKYINWFNKKLNKKFKGDKTAKGQFNARIKEGYNGNVFSKAMEEILKDKFHIESNFKWVTPEYLTREKQLEKWFNVDSTPVISEDRSKIMHPIGTRDKLFTQD